jgi:hypothetical protein
LLLLRPRQQRLVDPRTLAGLVTIPPLDQCTWRLGHGAAQFRRARSHRHVTPVVRKWRGDACDQFLIDGSLAAEHTGEREELWPRDLIAGSVATRGSRGSPPRAMSTANAPTAVSKTGVASPRVTAVLRFPVGRWAAALECPGGSKYRSGCTSVPRPSRPSFGATTTGTTASCERGGATSTEGAATSATPSRRASGISIGSRSSESGAAWKLSARLPSRPPKHVSLQSPPDLLPLRSTAACPMARSCHDPRACATERTSRRRVGWRCRGETRSVARTGTRHRSYRSPLHSDGFMDWSVWRVATSVLLRLPLRRRVAPRTHSGADERSHP